MITALMPQSSLFDALMAREDLFERLVALDDRFAKFHRVLVNEAIARRLTLAEVAAMLGIVADQLVGLAHDQEPDELYSLPAPPNREDVLAAGSPLVLDLRPVFDAGREPLAMVLDAAETLASDGSLKIIAPFHPVPLRRLMAERSFSSYAHNAGEWWEVTFARTIRT